MSNLEDRLLGEKTEYYCSTSESEDDDSENEDEVLNMMDVDPGPPPFNLSHGFGSVNTGPKGVIKDWQTYKQIEAEQREEREKERAALIQKLSLTCRSDLDEEKNRDPELSDFLEDPFLLEYSKQRMEEMFQKVSEKPRFGEVITLSSTEEFLAAIDEESKRVTIIVHIYDEEVSECDVMNSYLSEISKDYPEVKFCTLSASVAGVSKRFKANGVPALLVYKNETLVGNFVKITEELGNEYSVSDLENFLIEHAILLDKSCIPSLMMQSVINETD